MRFVTVGTGRCGTTWLSDVLTKAGCTTGHEDVWTPNGYTDLWWWHGDDGAVHELRGDVSLYAAPFLSDWDGPVLHQVRHPLDCIGSLVGWRLPSWPNKQGAGGEFVWDHLSWGSCGQQVVDSARYWCDWNEMCERGRTYLRYRVEDASPRLVCDLMDFVGEPVSPLAVEAAHKAFQPLSYRAAADRAPVALSWDDIPQPERGQVKRLAARYGYET